ncbi:MAG: DNA repair protein RecN [Eubacterium sp.]|nr:DNA repair protein RecN [Eubacterium sp.]
MLRELSIENLAIIEKASVTFGDKLNVFTGETGAGKSILIGGINAVLGARVNKDIVRAGADKAVVTALFDYIPDTVRKTLEDNGYSCEDELLLQREIYKDGKSTARINGRAATAAILKETAGELISIHGQHDNLLLMSNDRQRDILDNYGQTGELLNEYREVFREFSSLSRQIKKLSDMDSVQREKAEMLRQRIKEIDSFKFSEGEEAEVTEQLNKLRNFEFIQSSIYGALNAIAGDDDGDGAYLRLKNARDNINSLLDNLPSLSALSDRLNDLLIELEDIREEISAQIPRQAEDMDASLEYYEDRMSNILRLKRKYSSELDELLAQNEQWRQELYNIDNSDDVIGELTEQRREKGEQVKKLAAQLTDMRKTAADRLSKRIAEELAFLDMPDIRLVFDIKQDKVTLNGMDSVEMLISVNKGEELKPINKIASGGELSRIMLAIKNVLADSDNIQTMIFDEIDTGISGHAAQKVGVKLYQTAQSRQILCVTHLAQIAAMADTHLLIKKSTDNQRTFTGITSLDFEGRKKEIARIISGDENSNISLENAEELLKRKDII